MNYLDGKFKLDLLELLHNYEHPKRTAFTKRFPFLLKPVIFLRRTIQNLKNYFNTGVKIKKSKNFFDCVVARHQSLLRRKLGSSKPKLQEQKIQNLKMAIEKLNGIIIEPNKILSLWHIIGKPTTSQGYVNGMLLSNGRVVEGIGGGLCQLSNFLFWILLHAPTKVIKRHHHSIDVFPDSGRVLPFGSGATILYNFVDLQIKNISNQPLQIKIWLTDTHLKGQILSPKRIKTKYHVIEKDHCFLKRKNKYFRYNKIYRQLLINGKKTNEEEIATNFAPVMYRVNKKYLEKNNYKLFEL
jgi:vancomycin resistance protein VanW